MKNQLNSHNQLLVIIFFAILLRVFFLVENNLNNNLPHLGGDVCHHVSITKNIAENNSPSTDFLLSFQFDHEKIPALTDIYPPGPHLFVGLILKLIKYDYLNLQIILCIISILSIILLYSITLEKTNKNTAIIATFILSFNYYHILYSSIYLTTNIIVFFLCLFVFLFYKKNIFLIQLSSFVYGLLTISNTSFLLTLPVIIFFLNTKKISLFHKTIFILIISLPIIIWAVITNNYFNKPLFSLLSYYPFLDNWTEIINVDNKLENFVNFDFEKNSYVMGFAKSFFKNSLILFFTIFPFALMVLFLTIFLKNLNVINKINFKYLSNYKLIYILSITFFLSNIIGSRALGWELYPRHLLIICPLLLIPLSQTISKIINPKILILNKNFIIFILIFFLITIFEIFNINSFWLKDQRTYVQRIHEANKYIPKNSTVIYASTPQDFWCITDHKTINDPLFNNDSNNKKLIKSIFDKYNANYLIIDYSNDIYPRKKYDSHIKRYNELIDKKIFESKDKQLRIYKLYE